MTTFWLSFSSKTGFLGVVIVEAPSLAHAIRAAHQAKCNPGGSVASMQVTDEIRKIAEPADLAKFDALPRLKLMSRTELIERGIEIEPVYT